MLVVQMFNLDFRVLLNLKRSFLEHAASIVNFAASTQLHNRDATAVNVKILKKEMIMIVYKTWEGRNRIGCPTYTMWDGWFLFNVIPLYVRRTRVRR